MPTRISPAEAHRLMTDEGFTYIDVRCADEFAAGHPEGAVNIEWNDAFVAAIGARFEKDAALIVGCQVGKRSLRAAEALEGAGFTRVVDQRAGWDGARGTFGELLEPGWSRADLPSSGS